MDLRHYLTFFVRYPSYAGRIIGMILYIKVDQTISFQPRFGNVDV